MRFAVVTRDELWEPAGLREERLSWGQATMRAGEIAAVDELDEELLALVDLAAQSSLSVSIEPGEALRRVISARRAGGDAIIETVLVLRAHELSIVTTPEQFQTDAGLLRDIAAKQPELTVDYSQWPILWRGGSAAVLLHEAAGHPAEDGSAPLPWPPWLTAMDEPPFATDDVGTATRPADLLRSEEPSARRRASFADVPLPRLSNVVVRQYGAPSEVPESRIEIFLAGGGSFDPLSDAVSIHVSAAALVTDGRMQRVAPFDIVEAREAVARSIRGAAGPPLRYPGVICSREGQEIAVGSHAPLLLTQF